MPMFALIISLMMTSKPLPQLAHQLLIFKKKKKDAVPRFNLRGQQKNQKELHRTTSTSKNARQNQHVCISKDSFSSNDEIAVSFDEDVAAQISVHEGNDSDDLQSATNEIAKLRKENEALKKQIFKWENLSGDEIKNYTGLEESVFHTVVQIIKRF